MKGGDHIWKAAGVAPCCIYWRAFLKIARSALQHEGQGSYSEGGGVAPRWVYWQAFLKIARSALQHGGQGSHLESGGCCTMSCLLAGFSKDSAERVAT